jgi:ABC transport system ATP-binding/permease protein
MFKLVIQDDEGKTTVVPLIRDEITIGRKEGNTIRLTERNVSRRHARILRNNGEVHIEDLGSYNGIRVNNARIAERVSLRVSDQVQIGDYKLYLKAEGLEQTDDSLTRPLDRVDAQGSTESMPAMVAPPPMVAASAPAQMIGGVNRQMSAIGDTDPAGRSIGPATAAAVAAMTATVGYGRLVVVSSNFAGKEFELSRPQMIIGRTDENDIVINHRSISRNHAKVVREPETGRYTISDLQSSNGVRVNGQDYGKVELRRSDVVDLGHVRLRFVEAGEDFVFARDAVITDVPEAGSRRGLVVAVLAALVVLVGGAVLLKMRTPSEPANGGLIEPAINSGSADTPGQDDGSDTAVAAKPPETPTEPGQGNPGTAVAPTNPGNPTNPGTAAGVKPDDLKAQVGKCAELASQSKWQALEDCATELDALGPSSKDKAGEFHEKARRETQNERHSADIARLIREGNLKGAQASLRQVGDDSVYSKTARETFTRAENQAAEAARRTAQGYVNNRDCAALRRYVAQQRDSSTEKVAGAAAALVARCAAVPDPVATRPPAVGSAGAGSAAVVAPAQPPQPPAARSGCDGMDVDELMSQAVKQNEAGYAKAALNLVIKALACRQDARMYRFAVTYACAAHDLASAKLYFVKVPKEFQPPLEQKCQQERLDVRGP